jgi:L-threonylcarbamoyladenylate synthase
MPAAGRQLAARFWPGALTLVVRTRAPLPAGVGANGTVGVRVTPLEIARAIINAAGTPVAAARVAADPGVVEDTLGGAVDLLIDTGPAPAAVRSTIVDVAGIEPRLVRAGAIPWEEVQRALSAGSPK